MIHFLPSNADTSEVDVLLVSGDAYIDHPSFGVAIIARVLENIGCSVCIVSQPEYYEPTYLSKLPSVKLFIGISAGNLDSVVANYTSNRTIRKQDSFSIDGDPFFANGKPKRPDRATIFYTSYFKQRYKDIPVVLGGIEASLRRTTHYDYIQQKIRKSILTDSKADIIIYSMGEAAVREVAQAIQHKQPLDNIRGTAIRSKILPACDYILLPSFADINNDKSNMIKLNKLLEDNMNVEAVALVQDQGNELIIINPPQPSLSTQELDSVYALPYQKNYPDYCYRVPAWNMIKESITSHRGCFGRCSFCAITLHQGAQIVSRSTASIISEAQRLQKLDFFHKTITDVGGPTANMYGLDCKIGWCKSPHCLFPKVCSNLIINEKYLALLQSVKNIDGVKNVFVSSGLRHDLALLKQHETEWIITNATSGHLKIAPEHIDNKILSLMRKPSNETFVEFIKFFENIKKKYSLKFYILPYIILSFPGSSLLSAKRLKKFLVDNKIKTYQFQDFTPTPSTEATAMYYAGVDSQMNVIPIPKVSNKNNAERDVFK